MQQFINLDRAHVDGPTYVTIGNFDGMHRGHQALLRRLRQLAESAPAWPDAPPAQTALVTFDPHPLAVLRPHQPHRLLTTPAERLAMAAELGIDVGVIQRFSLDFAALQPIEFLQLLKRHLKMAALVVGPDFALGRNRSGDIPTLTDLGKTVGYVLHVVDPIIWDGEIQVRSNSIRQAVGEGNVERAAEMLGRPYIVSGTVFQGDQRGRQLGIPTANLLTPPEKLLPADGVYVTLATVQTERGPRQYPSVTNLGVRPTVDGLRRRLETHLLDFPTPGQTDNLYGQELTVAFVAHLRGEVRFSSLEALVNQIHMDIDQARLLFQRLAPPALV
ncbi:MAG: bifunctional riboflavin kinase/FAD synthetase [Caldilineaceae bacterium]|nr:bifunctional riboflavin kinase/FAD synthetase [Caldilineaceae bacterium]